MNVFVPRKKLIGKLRRAAQWMAHATTRTALEVTGTLRGNRANAYWFQDLRNFGDLITPLLLRQYGFTPVPTPPSRAQLVAAGSILTHVPEGFEGFIVGSGLVRDVVRPFPHARILAVRGELTRDRIGAPRHVTVGDPGLLASTLMPRREIKRYKLGLVPHHCDRGDPRVIAIQRRYGNDVLVIDVMRRPLDVFADIDRCECILSSSLHGIVTADSLGIANAYMPLSDRVLGGGFKFADYASALGKRMDPITLTGTEKLSDLLARAQPPPASVDERRQALGTAFGILRVELSAS